MVFMEWFLVENMYWCKKGNNLKKQILSMFDYPLLCFVSIHLAFQSLHTNCLITRSTKSIVVHGLLPANYQFIQRFHQKAGVKDLGMYMVNLFMFSSNRTSLSPILNSEGWCPWVTLVQALLRGAGPTQLAKLVLWGCKPTRQVGRGEQYMDIYGHIKVWIDRYYQKKLMWYFSFVNPLFANPLEMLHGFQLNWYVNSLAVTS